MENFEFEQVESFGIDNGELSDLSPQECFVLGVEWQMIAGLADESKGFSKPIHSNNKDRLSALLDKRGRTYTFIYMSEDSSESWMLLSVSEEKEY